MNDGMYGITREQFREISQFPVIDPPETRDPATQSSQLSGSSEYTHDTPQPTLDTPGKGVHSHSEVYWYDPAPQPPAPTLQPKSKAARFFDRLFKES